MKQAQMFPVKTMLAVAMAVTLLIAPRWAPWVSAWATFSPKSIPELWNMPVPAPPELPPGPTVAQLQADRDAALAPEHLLDLGRPLDHFYEALHKAEEKGGIVRVLHFGDSPTTADLITADVRAMLQKEFGDAGHGFVLTARPWAWYNHRNVGINSQDWQIEIAGVMQKPKPAEEAPEEAEAEGDAGSVASPRDEPEEAEIAPRAPRGVYGLGGARFLGGPGAESTWTIIGQNSVEISYLAKPEPGSFELLADGEVIAAAETYSLESMPAWVTFPLPQGAKEFTLRVKAGVVQLFGVEFRKDRRGIVYSSLGINGASVTMLSRVLERAHFATQLRHYRPDLVVLAYGTNESGFPEFVNGPYRGELRNAIRRVRAALPESSILVMSPMDRGEKREDGTIGTIEALPRLVEIEQEVAAEQKVAFFNTFAAMGGPDTMARWYVAEPRLVGADFIHPMPGGARMVGELLYRALSDGYNEYKLRRQSRSEVRAQVDTKRPSGDASTAP